MSQAASKFIGFMTKGFGSAMEMFAPAVIIIAFFSIGNQETAQQILGEDVSGILSDLVHALVSGLHVPELCLPVVQSMAGILYSMDGSGFAGLTVIGEIAQSYHVSGECAKILTSAGADRDYLGGKERDCDPLGCDPGLCNMRSVTARTCKEKSHPGSLRACRHDRVCCDSHGSCIRLQHQKADGHDHHAQKQSVDRKLVISVFSGGRKQLRRRT